MAKPIDYDALLKDFITDFFPDLIAFANPLLYAAIDWDRGYVFLEQELINALRGKFKVRGKRRQTDKLVKVYLKNGLEHFVFVHIEFQHKKEKGFGRRMFVYRALIGLRYGLDNITAMAIFTGAPPPAEERSYYSDTFGTSIEYKFGTVIAAELEEDRLLEVSNNPFALAMLAALYAYQSRNKPKVRLGLKNQLFALVKSQDIGIDKIVKMLIFVRDYVNLPQKLENEFQETQFSLVFPNAEAMTISKGTKEFAVGLYEHVFGYDPETLLKEEKKKAQELLDKERQVVIEALRREEEGLQKAEEERQKAEEERLRLDNTIRYLHETVKMSAAEIATIVDKEIVYIEKLLASANENDQD